MVVSRVVRENLLVESVGALGEIPVSMPVELSQCDECVSSSTRIELANWRDRGYIEEIAGSMISGARRL